MLAVILKILGVQAVPIDDHFALNMNESQCVHLHWHAPTRYLILFSEVASLEQFEVSVDLLKMLMEANCFWSGTAGATLCIEKEKNSLLLIHKLYIDEKFISENNIKDFFEGFFNAAAFWFEKFSLVSEALVKPFADDSQEKMAALNLSQKLADESAASFQASIQYRA